MTQTAIPSSASTVRTHRLGDSVHFTLQGKGGVGKSLVASILAQYLSHKHFDLKCYDTDPVNQTFHSYKGLNVSHLVLMKGAKIDERQFDCLMDDIYKNQRAFVVDNGSSSFLALTNYFGENDTFEIISETGKEVVIHCVVTGGQAMDETFTGLLALLQQTRSAKIIVWLNEYFGPIEHEGKSFKDMAMYVNNKHKIHGVVTIEARNPETFGVDVRAMLESKRTFEESVADAANSVWVKALLTTVRSVLFKQLDAVFNG